MISREGWPSLTPRYSHVIPGTSGNHSLSTTWPSKFAVSGAVVVTGVEPAGRLDVLLPELPPAAATRARPTTMESAKKCLMTGEATQVKSDVDETGMNVPLIFLSCDHN